MLINEGYNKSDYDLHKDRSAENLFAELMAGGINKEEINYVSLLFYNCFFRKKIKLLFDFKIGGFLNILRSLCPRLGLLPTALNLFSLRKIFTCDADRVWICLSIFCVK